MANAWYIHGVIPVSADIAGKPALEHVCTVTHGWLKAVLSRHTRPAADVAARQDDIEALAHRHHAVLQALLAFCTPVPLRLGTFFDNTDSVTRFLETAHAPLSQMLTELQGRHEWGLKLGVDDGLALQLEQSPDLRTLNMRIDASAEGARYLLVKQRDHLLARARESWLLGKAHLLCERLQPHTQKWLTCAAFESETHKAAALVDQSQEPLFRETAAKFQAELAGLATLAITGPWAPYNFVPPLELPAHEPSAADQRDRQAAWHFAANAMQRHSPAAGTPSTAARSSRHP